MTALFVGNATRQTYAFAFRAPVAVPGVSGLPLRTHMIEPGTFTRIPGEWSPEEADSIVQQHVPYGIIRDGDIDRSREYHGIVYSIDKPITRSRLLYLMDHNLGHLVMRGQDIRRANAIAQSDLVQKALVENGRNERVEAFDSTIQQEESDPRNNVAQLSVGTLVKRHGDTPSPRPARATRRKAA
jgi:hypothetical protein